jgi:transcriptional regulator with XRE-family HTH domain
MKSVTQADIEKMRQMKRNGKTTREIKEKIGWSNTTVASHTQDVTKKWKDPEWLRSQREQGKTQEEIAEGLPVGQATISKWETKLGVEKPWRDKEKLRELYVDKGLSSVEIAKRYGLGSHTTIIQNLRRVGIKVNDPLWVIRSVESPKDGEGSDLYYGPNWRDQREKVLAAYGYECQYEACTTSGPDLDVHHIKPLREFESFEQANRIENLIPYCSKHHGKVETNQ